VSSVGEPIAILAFMVRQTAFQVRARSVSYRKSNHDRTGT